MARVEGSSPSAGGAVAVAVGRGLTGLVDALFRHVALVHSLILQNLMISARTSSIAAAIPGIRTVTVCIAHAYVFYLLQRRMPAGMSYFSFMLPAFFNWSGFAAGADQADPRHAAAPFYALRQIGWIHVWMGHIVWNFLSTAVIAAVAVVGFELAGEKALSQPFRLDFLPGIVLLYFLSSIMGLGVGAILTHVKHLLPIAALPSKIFLYFMFITSGVIEAYAQMPETIKNLFFWNPMVHVNEFTRASYSSNYYMPGVTLWYPLAFTAGTMLIGLLLLKKEGVAKP